MQTRIEFDAPADEVVVKANDLIRGRHSFSTIEQRIFVKMVAQLGQEEEFPVQEISLRQICDGAGTDPSNLYRMAGEIADGLLGQTIEMQTEEGGQRRFTKYNCFSLCEHVEGSGVLRAKFNDDMRPFLLELKEKYTLYLVTVFLRLRSKYATQIYELLKMRQGLRKLRMSVEEFRRTLALENKYGRFSSLKRRVLEQARTELREKADLYFTYDVLREGNVPTELEFYVHENESVVEELHEEAAALPEASLPVDVEASNANSRHGPDLNPKGMFMADLTQEQINSVDRDWVDALHDEARTQAEGEYPDTKSEVVLQQRTYALMKEAWGARS